MFARVLDTFVNLMNTPPNVVVVGKPQSYASRTITKRAPPLLLYEQLGNTPHEIVLQPSNSTSTVFSLFRSTDINEIETKFECYKDTIPTIINLCSNLENQKSLQVLCNVLTDNPTWKVAHVAVELQLHNVLKDASVRVDLDQSAAETGMTPLHLAVVNKNKTAIDILLSAGCSLEKRDVKGNTVYHFAAKSSADVIKLLGKKSKNTLNDRNSLGYTALHMACLTDNIECVNELLSLGADVNIDTGGAGDSSWRGESSRSPSYVGNFMQENAKKIFKADIKCGGTPLHWSCSREVCDSLIDMKCNINAVNFQGRTALHVMVVRDRLDCVIALLSRGALVDCLDVDGNTPLHLAVLNQRVKILQALIVFDADLNLLNNEGVSARHLCEKIREKPNSDILYILDSVGAHRCPASTPGCTDGCRHGDSYNGTRPPRIIGPDNRDHLDRMLDCAAMEVASTLGHNRKNRASLLCLDGGGIRGLILIQIIIELEKHLNRPIIHCFDWVAGTSTGGILALGLASGKTAKECQGLYFQLKERVFVGKRPYGSEKMESLLKEVFGSDTKMSTVKHPKLMVTTVMGDRKPIDFHIFRNYECATDILNEPVASAFTIPLSPPNQNIWEAARATSAAPSYFRPFKGYLDGGLMSNNPTIDAMTEIHEYNLALKATGRRDEAKPLGVVVSLGCGVIPKSVQTVADVSWPDGVLEAMMALTHIRKMIDVLVDQATQAEGRVVDRARALCSMCGIHFYRFSPPISEDIGLDERDDSKLVQMLWETKAYIQSKRADLKEIVDVTGHAK